MIDAEIEFEKQLCESRAWSSAWHTTAQEWRKLAKEWSERYALPETERYKELFTDIDLLQEEIKQLRRLPSIARIAELEAELKRIRNEPYVPDFVRTRIEKVLDN